MSSQLREKIALIVFCLLVVFGLGVGCWYLFAGHSWNVAASNIDDSFGSMDDYTCIMFEGTEKTLLEDVDNALGSGGASAALGSSGASQRSAENSSASENLIDPEVEVEEPLSLGEVEQDYVLKGARVITLDTTNPTKYAEPMIVSANGRRYGVFSVDEGANINAVKAQLLYLDKYALDSIVAIVPNETYLKGCSGIDVAVCVNDANMSLTGDYVGDTFSVSAPDAGNIGVILVSPSNVVSYKTITSL